MWRNETILRTNLVTNPSFTTNTTGWTANVAGGVISRDTSSVLDTTGCLKVTGGGGTGNDSYNDSYTYCGPSASITNKFTGMTVGNTYTISADAVLGATFTGSLNPRTAKIVFFIYAPSLGSPKEYQSTVATTTASRLSLTVTIPADATGWAVRFYNGSNVATDVIYWNNVMIEQASSVLPYFDGSSVDPTGNLSQRWTGTANTSTSQQYLSQLVGPPQGFAAYSTSTLEHWFCDFYDLTNYAFGVTKIENSSPSVRGDFSTVPQRNGVVGRSNRSYEAGEFSLSMWVVGCDEDGSVPSYSNATRRALFERNLTMLFKLLGAQNGPVTLSKVRVAPSSDVDPGATEIITSRAYSTGSTSIDTMMGRNRAEVVFTFTLIDSFWSGPTTSAVGNNTNTYTANLLNMGDAPVDDSVITITGPVASPVVTCPESGVSFKYNGTLTTGQTLVIDSGAWTATLNGSTNVIQNMTHSGHARFMYIPPRDVISVSLNPTVNFYPKVVLTGTGLTSASSVSASYTTKYQVA